MADIESDTVPSDILRIKGLDGEWIIHRRVGDTLYLFERSPTGYDDGFYDPEYYSHGDYDDDDLSFEGWDGGPALIRASVNDIIDETPIGEPNVGNYVLWKYEGSYFFGEVRAVTLSDGAPVACTVHSDYIDPEYNHRDLEVEHDLIVDVIVDAAQVTNTCGICASPPSKNLKPFLWGVAVAMTALVAFLTMLAD